MTENQLPAHLSILDSFESLPRNAKLSIFGAGETGQEFVRKLRVTRPDAQVVCFFDSYRTGAWDGIEITRPSQIAQMPESHELIIASVFWNEIASLIENSFSRRYSVLSNNLINQASHLSSYGPFYFAENETAQLEKRLKTIEPRFRSDLDKEIIRKLFDLRMHRRERDFFEYVNQLTREQKKTFTAQDKYARHLDLNSVAYVVEGGVYDGQDTFQLLETLKTKPQFKKIYAFDPFLGSLHAGTFFEKIDSKLCEFHERVLWDCEEKVSFRVDRANPANSTVLRGTEISADTPSNKIHQTTTIDTFMQAVKTSVDLIKLDVEGSEMKVLTGAKESIKAFKPKMAISIYHCKEHMIEIPELLLSLNPDYQFSISVNNPSFVDMVLYAN